MCCNSFPVLSQCCVTGHASHPSGPMVLITCDKSSCKDSNWSSYSPWSVAHRHPPGRLATPTQIVLRTAFCTCSAASASTRTSQWALREFFYYSSAFSIIRPLQLGELTAMQVDASLVTLIVGYPTVRPLSVCACSTVLQTVWSATPEPLWGPPPLSFSPPPTPQTLGIAQRPATFRGFLMTRQ